MLLYHLVCPAKYRRVAFSDDVERHLRDVCIDISKRYEIEFLEMGVDKDHCHFLIQAIPTLSPSKIAQIVKSITAREIFKRVPEVKKKLWGGEFWTEGYFIGAVSKHGNEETIQNYVKNQGRDKEYQKIYSQQIMMF